MVQAADGTEQDGATVVGEVTLAFADARLTRHLDDPVAKDLSAVARIGDTLFLACDEAAGLERLRRVSDERFGDHQHLLLGDFFTLPGGSEEEMDIEGLAVAEGYLWIVGSHALKRKKPDDDDARDGAALAQMAKVEREANRYFLGRLPLAEGGAGAFVPRASIGGRHAAALGAGRKDGGLTRWLRKDVHLAPFLKVPSKENGLDIEGIAVRGERVWLGLRGPVLRGHAVVLDLALKETGSDRLKPRRLETGRRYRKHLLDTAGLGIRDLRLDGEDMLLLVGPTMALEGTALVLRWRGALHDTTEGLVPTDRLERVAELPYGRRTDHPEGLELWPEAGRGAFLVVYDAPGPRRISGDGREVRADILRGR
jgi:hypothetical protein